MDDTVIVKYFEDLSAKPVLPSEQISQAFVDFERTHADLLLSLDSNNDFWSLLYDKWQAINKDQKVSSKLSVFHSGVKHTNSKISRDLDNFFQTYKTNPNKVQDVISLKIRKSIYYNTLCYLANNNLLDELQSDLFNQVKKIKDDIINSTLRLVVTFAKPYRSKGIHLADLIQQGNLGLLQAIDKFDINSGTRFSTYARWWVRQACIKQIKAQNRIHIPAHIQDKLLKIRREGNDSGDMDGATYERLNAISAQPLSLDAPLRLGSSGDGNSDGIEEGLAGILYNEDQKLPDEETDLAKLSEAISSELINLDPLSREIVVLRRGLFGNAPHNFDEIAELKGFSKETARKLESAALAKMNCDNLRKFL